MKAHLPIALFLGILFAGPAASAWVGYELDLPAQTRESAWRDALAVALNGQSEVPIEGGRIDVLTDKWAIEVDWPNKWHEGLGQALHYSDATGKQGVVALISYTGKENLREKSRKRFELVDKQCEKNGIKLVVLFPTKPRENISSTPDGLQKTHWLNTKSKSRHNNQCRYYRNTARGRESTSEEGKACSLCGG